MLHRIWLAIKAFFLILFSAEVARGVDEVLLARKARAGQPAAPSPAPVREAPPPAPKERPTPRLAARSDALTLLASLQREARFIDFVQEPLAGYSDAQIGAAARDVHRDCRAVLERMFAIQPALEADEGAAIEVPAGFDAGRYRLTGNVTGQPPFSGKLVHHGWEAGKCEVPTWSGSERSARIIAPVEVELA